MESTIFLEGRCEPQQKVIKLKIQLIIRSANDKNYDCKDILIDRSVDFCRVNEKSMSGPILSVVYQAIVEVSFFQNHLLNCGKDFIALNL